MAGGRPIPEAEPGGAKSGLLSDSGTGLSLVCSLVYIRDPLNSPEEIKIISNIGFHFYSQFNARSLFQMFHDWT